jgi:hypothetical protein
MIWCPAHNLFYSWKLSDKATFKETSLKTGTVAVRLKRSTYCPQSNRTKSMGSPLHATWLQLEVKNGYTFKVCDRREKWVEIHVIPVPKTLIIWGPHKHLSLFRFSNFSFFSCMYSIKKKPQINWMTSETDTGTRVKQYAWISSLYFQQQ